MKQTILKASEDYSELTFLLKKKNIQTILLVCDNAFHYLRIAPYFSEIKKNGEIKIITFSDFNPNPLYESVEKGVTLFCEEECDMIVAVGGGSAIDVAKCIKLYSNMDREKNFLIQEIVPNQIPFLAIPTTGGTGSEATRYAVIYFNGEKQSITHDSCIPDTVLFDPSFLLSLPEYQKKSTMLDAFCHSIESYWSVNSTKESKQYSFEALKLIIENKDNYLIGKVDACENILKAANLAGKAINITQTTAGHAMSYKLTSLYGISHGHSAALCLSVLVPYMINHTDKCIDKRGEKYLFETFEEISKIFGYSDITEGADAIIRFISSFGLKRPDNVSVTDIDILKNSVNPVRLKNNPVSLSTDAIEKLYIKLLNIGE